MGKSLSKTNDEVDPRSGSCQPSGAKNNRTISPFCTFAGGIDPLVVCAARAGKLVSFTLAMHDADVK